jgi:hypothetical protein
MLNVSKKPGVTVFCATRSVPSPEALAGSETGTLPVLSAGGHLANATD